MATNIITRCGRVVGRFILRCGQSYAATVWPWLYPDDVRYAAWLESHADQGTKS